MTTKSSLLAQKYYDGDRLSDAEILLGVELFGKAADVLVLLGPVFELAFMESSRLSMRFKDIQVARGLK